MKHPILLTILFTCMGLSGENLLTNPHLLPSNGKPDGYTLKGDVIYSNLTRLRKENTGHGIRLLSGEDINRDKSIAGAVSTTVRTGIPRDSGRWLRFRICGLAQEGFKVENDNLHLKAEFFTEKGKVALDHIQTRIYGLIERERKDLRDPGTNSKLGPATWRTYSLDFRTPFREIDTIRLTAGFSKGIGKRDNAEFLINEMKLIPIPTPIKYTSDKSPPPQANTSLKEMVHIGGRWYYDPKGGSRKLPELFNHRNADRLIYASNRPLAPFANNMTSWLRAGWVDRNGKIADKDRFVPDNLNIRITGDSLVFYSRNLPNHPTAIFPDVHRTVDGNPNRIQEKDNTWYIPLEPLENKGHKAMDKKNANRALPRGPIGLAVNGVIFFNPFDHINDADAVWRMDRCCGHPSPTSAYHYHKYPVCVKTPWRDEGDGHSPVIGFAFDGFPLYGPYEAKGKLAKTSEANPLNDFNIHHDEQRGWHYHVTPGQYPHIIGGYWGNIDERNRRRPPGRNNLGPRGSGQRPGERRPPPGRGRRTPPPRPRN
jgi:hypothetical protein